MNRDSSYDINLAAELQDREFAKDFLIALMEGTDGLNLVEALKHTIRRMGIKEFSKISKIPEKSISRMLHSDYIAKINTLDEYLAPLGLKTKLGIIDIDAA